MQTLLWFWLQLSTSKLYYDVGTSIVSARSIMIFAPALYIQALLGYWLQHCNGSIMMLAPALYMPALLWRRTFLTLLQPMPMKFRSRTRPRSGTHLRSLGIRSWPGFRMENTQKMRSRLRVSCCMTHQGQRRSSQQLQCKLNVKTIDSSSTYLKEPVHRETFNWTIMKVGISLNGTIIKLSCVMVPL